MAIILKYILKNIKEKKLRTFLIIFSIALSAALVYASNAIAQTFFVTYLEIMKKYYGTAEIEIFSNDQSPHWLFRNKDSDHLNDKIEYSIGVISTRGEYKFSEKETQRVRIWGVRLKDLPQLSPVTIVEQKNLDPFNGNKIIISTYFAQKYNLKCGQFIEVKIDQHKHKLKVAAIGLPQGILRDDAQSASFLLPRKKLEVAFQTHGRVDQVLVKTKDKSMIPQVIAELKKLYPRYQVEETISQAELKQELKEISVPFNIMTILVLIMSIFIIYTSFKVITMERLPVIGTFRSVGANRATTDFILTAESLFYGLAGGLIGLVLGIIILRIMTYVMAYDPWSKTRYPIAIDYSPEYLFFSLTTAFLLSGISALIPIIRVSKIPIKELILGLTTKIIKKKYWKYYLGSFCFVLSVSIPNFADKEYAFIINVFCIIGMIVSIILLIPLINWLFIYFFQKLYQFIFGNIGILAAGNLRNNKSILNNITLLAIGISAIFMINTVSISINKTLIDFYSSAHFNIWMWIWKGDRRTEGILKAISGVQDTYGLFSMRNLEVENKKRKIKTLEGINPEYLQYWDFDIDPKKVIRLADTRSILLTYKLKELLEVERNQILTLKTPSGKKNYLVIGFFNSIRNNGRYALIADKYYKLDMNERYYSNILIKTNKDSELTLLAVKDKMRKRSFWAETITRMRENESKSNQQIVVILQGFSLLALIIGIFGVFNNYVINSIERRRSFAMFRAVGMSRKQVIKMLLIEALSGGIVGGISGVIAGTLIIKIASRLLETINISLSITYSFQICLINVVMGMVITIIAQIGPALKTAKMDLITAIKYE
ncbi:MAG: FtsX-like permease family protein [Spirochaetes bacterium]|nr:FtsX-like permease family protein [Spirochaetota bacterium]